MFKRVFIFVVFRRWLLWLLFVIREFVEGCYVWMFYVVNVGYLRVRVCLLLRFWIIVSWFVVLIMVLVVLIVSERWCRYGLLMKRLICYGRCIVVCWRWRFLEVYSRIYLYLISLVVYSFCNFWSLGIGVFVWRVVF